FPRSVTMRDGFGEIRASWHGGLHQGLAADTITNAMMALAMATASTISGRLGLRGRGASSVAVGADITVSRPGRTGAGGETGPPVRSVRVWRGRCGAARR